jgi:hypothetical protein
MSVAGAASEHDATKAAKRRLKYAPTRRAPASVAGHPGSSDGEARLPRALRSRQ